MANILGVIQYVGQIVLSFGVGFAGIVYGIKKLKEKKGKK